MLHYAGLACNDREDCVEKQDRSVAVVMDSVQGASTTNCSTKTNNLIFLKRKLVVVSNLFVHFYVASRIDDDLLLRLDTNDLRVAVWLQAAIHNTINQIQRGILSQTLLQATTVSYHNTQLQGSI